MSILNTLILTGTSGKEYNFNVYPLDTQFKAVGAVYYISKRTVESNGQVHHECLYIGQTKDLSKQFQGNQRNACFDQLSANCISTHYEENEHVRLAIETDLINVHACIPCKQAANA